MKKFEDYYLGLDLGTGSVGWAVTNEKYDILKFNKKFMWGTHLFDTGKTAAERRSFRTARRRLKRRKNRIELLQSLFSEEISKKDFGFYQRLKESQYHLEDRSINNKNTLFMDKDYTDKDYHKEYPTIYHLRKALIDNDKNAFEIRKLYLALAHILSHRGHFLFEGKMNGSESQNFEELFFDLIRFIQEDMELKLEIREDVSIEDIKQILTDRNLSNTRKKEKLSKFLVDEKNKSQQEILKLLVGNEARISIIFNNKDYEEIKISFNRGDYDEKEEEYEAVLAEKIEFVRKIKAVYDWILLQEILKEERYLSYSKVKLYEEHKEDLNNLKKIIKEIGKKEYKEIFSTKNGLYEKYIKNNEPLRKTEKKSEKKVLYYKIKEILQKADQIPQSQNIFDKIELDTFLPRQKIKNNGVIPRQVHQKELEIILKNAEKHFEWLKKYDETNLSVSEKIIKIFEFKIPYYIGPLNKKSPFAWIERKETGKIFPWNFKEIIDEEGTAKAFIRKMTNKCTYLTEKDVIPKNSLLYTKFTVLNELNNLKIKGEKREVELKQKIYNKLFQNNKKVGMKILLEFLKSENIKVEKSDITGIDGTFNTSLGSYIDMKKIFGEENIKKDSYKEMIENIILWMTLYGDEKRLIKNKIKEKYSDKVNEEQLKLILKLKYTGWSRLSKEFLTEIEALNPNSETGEMMNIIRRMWETNDNLMELLSYRYNYSEEIKAYNGEIKFLGSFNYKDLDEKFQVSPNIKKMIWRALLITKELKKIMKKAPKKIFIEMARDVYTEKKRTEKRKDRLTSLYKEIKNDSSVKELEKKLKNITDEQLKSKKLYLYYLQLGKCMYSGEKIKLEDLMNDELYDIDHIYPQSQVKDDSFDNIVLVKKNLNLEKMDIYPLSVEIRKKCESHWKLLKEKKLISLKKYERLIRTEEFSDDELAGFISRQIVETRQATKILAEILKSIFGNETRVVYVKAGLTSEFRQKFEMYKFRELNDYHHAHDGYLNIIVGNIYNTKFTDNPYNFIKKHKSDDEKKYNRKFYNLKKIFDFNNDVWNKEEMIPKIEKYLYKIRPLFTRASYEQKGGFSEQNISSPQEGLRSVKEKHPILSDTLKYGGFNSVKNSYFFIVEYTEKNKRIRSIEVLPIFKKKEIKDKKDLEKYCIENLKLSEPKILLEKLKYKSLIHTDGHDYIINSKTDDSITIQNAVQILLKKENYETFRKINRELEFLKNEFSLSKIKHKFDERITKLLRKNKTENELSKEEATERIDELYKEIYFKISNKEGVFRNLKTGVMKYLSECYSEKEYELLTMYEKSRIVQEIVNIINKQHGKFDLTDVYEYSGNLKKGFSKKFNIRINRSKVLDNDFYIINQSPTGLFEKKIYPVK